MSQEPKKIVAYKADALQYTNQTRRELPGLVIEFSELITDDQRFTRAFNKEMRQQGREIAEALRKSAPSGVIDAMLDQLLLRRREEEDRRKADANQLRRQNEANREL